MNYYSKVKEIIGDKNLKAFVRTFGCQLNENDSEKIRGMLYKMGYSFTDSIDDADFILFNTCAIRENAEKKTYGSIGVLKGMKAEHPEKIIAVSGCMTGEEHFIKRLKSTYRHVDIIFGANNIDKLPQLLYEHLIKDTRIFNTEYDEGIVSTEGLPHYRDSKIRAGVPIMYGCNNFCAYCIVPYVRGRERSRSRKDIIDEVLSLKNSGYKEVMLLGQNVNSFEGGGDSFAELLEEVSDTGIERIRFMTPHPKDISPAVIDIMAARGNICNSLHLPVQAGNNEVLLRMNRRYTKEKFLDIVNMVREKIPDITLTTDVIVGFPGETCEQFEDTLDVLTKARFDMIYSFIFSPRKGTPAETMEDVLSEEEKKANFDRMIDLQNKISLEKNEKLVGQTLPVLVEGESKTNPDTLTGRTEGGKIVNFIGSKNLISTITPLKIVSAKTWNLLGQI